MFSPRVIRSFCGQIVSRRKPLVGRGSHCLASTANAAEQAITVRNTGDGYDGNGHKWSSNWSVAAAGAVVVAGGILSDRVNCNEELTSPLGKNMNLANLPVEYMKTTFAPDVPPPITRKKPAHVIVEMDTTAELLPMTASGDKYPTWTFGGHVPGPFLRTRVGDTLEVRYTNKDATGIGHNIDFHSVSGPGGGAPALYAETDQTKVGVFKMLYPGLYVYHCAAAPVPMHIANGMYGLILVEPEEGLPKVDREFYVMQSEFYYTEPDTTPVSKRTSSKKGWFGKQEEASAGAADEPEPCLVPSYRNGLDENPQSVVFNGREGALTDKPLMAKQNETVRIFFGNGGPNLTSAFHVIGTIFDKVYREGDLISPPGRGIQTTSVPPGGSTVVDIKLPVTGSFTLVDHAIFRLDKGCVGFLKVSGNDPNQNNIYAAGEMPVNCPGCKLHN